MTVRRKALITERAYAVLLENKRGDLKWHVRRPQPGMVELEIDSTTYDQMLKAREEWNLATISDVIIEAYKRGPGTGGTLGSEAMT